MFFYIFLIVVTRLIANNTPCPGSLGRYNSSFLSKFAKKSKNSIVSNFLIFSTNYALSSSETQLFCNLLT